MAANNSLTSNVTRKLMRVFLKHFESNRVVTKTVNTQLFEGKFNPASGTTVDIKRPHDYTTVRTTGGDISSSAKDDITSGKATATVQDYFTAATEWNNIEEALQLDQLDEILAPMARRMVTDLETDFAQFMLENSGLVHGTPGTAVTAWKDVAEAGALMSSIGVPKDMPWYYLINPFTQVTLADLQGGGTNATTRGAGNLTEGMVASAWERAQISKDFGGMAALTANALGSVTTPAFTDLIGAVMGTPQPSYRVVQASPVSLSIANSMQQVITIDALTDSLVIPAGTVVEVPTRFLLNQSTRQPALDASGNNIPWRGVVQRDATEASGVVTIVVSSPAVFDSEATNTNNPQYNTVVAPIADDDVINILNAASTTFQPNLFYHPQAFSMASVKLPKLFSTDTTVTTEDGFSLRVSKYSDGDANLQKIRFDLLPAYATLNPWFAGHGWKT